MDEEMTVGEAIEDTGHESESGREPDTGELVAEIERLRGEVGRLQEWQSRSRQELDEFCTLFPGISIVGLPPEVQEEMARGVPPAAAYALFEKRESARKNAEKRSAERSWHGMKEHGGEEYFSPAEVRAMTQKEVHKNYKKIMESMKHWK